MVLDKWWLRQASFVVCRDPYLPANVFKRGDASQNHDRYGVLMQFFNLHV